MARRTAPRRRRRRDDDDLIRIPSLAFAGVPLRGHWPTHILDRMKPRWSGRDLEFFAGSIKLVCLAGKALASDDKRNPRRTADGSSFYEVNPVEVPDLVARGLAMFDDRIPADDDSRTAAAAIGAIPTKKETTK